MGSSFKNWQIAINQALDFVLPPRCVVTGEPVERQGIIAPSAWAQLNFIVGPMCVRCGLPFEFDVEGEMECGSCAERPPDFSAARAALKYDDLSRDLVLKFKHADQTHLVKAFTPWLMRAGQSFMDQADFILPVPLHRWRLLKRRYNQAALMAGELARQTKTPHLPEALMRVRATPTQGHLKPKERQKNVRNAFQVHPDFRPRLKNSRIVLIDDVYTTGATVNECVRILKRQAGAAEIYILTLARVVKN